MAKRLPDRPGWVPVFVALAASFFVTQQAKS